MNLPVDQNAPALATPPCTLAPPRRIGVAAELFLVLAAALVWTIVVRSPWRLIEGSDDAFFMEVAHLWTRGVLPYAGAFDVKPPGYFAILAAAEILLGSTLQTLKTVTIFFDAVTATTLYFLGCRMGSRKIGFFSATLYPILSHVVVNNPPYAPLATFTTLSFVAAFSQLPIIRKAALAGLAIGLAATVKQTAAFEGIALLAFFLSAPETAARRITAEFIFALAAAFAPMAFLFYFAAHGAADVLIADVILNALHRPASAIEGLSFLEGLARSLLFLAKPVVALLAFACLALIRRRMILAATPQAPIGATGVWGGAAAVSVWAQRSLFPAYLGPMLAPLLLLAGACLVYAAPELKRIAATARLGLLGLATVALSIVYCGDGLGRRQETEAIAIAAKAIAASDPAPTDKLLVVNRSAWLYLATDLAPPTAYFHWEHTLAQFPGAGPTRLAEALATMPRYIIVADRRQRVKYELAESWRHVDTALASDYRLLSHVQGDRDAYDVYEAIPKPRR